VESWLKVIREAAPRAPGRDGKPAPVKKLSKRFLEQQRKGK
jgi:hypothetical protein